MIGRKWQKMRRMTNSVRCQIDRYPLIMGPEGGRKQPADTAGKRRDEKEGGYTMNTKKLLAVLLAVVLLVAMSAMACAES